MVMMILGYFFVTGSLIRLFTNPALGRLFDNVSPESESILVRSAAAERHSQCRSIHCWASTNATVHRMSVTVQPTIGFSEAEILAIFV